MIVGWILLGLMGFAFVALAVAIIREPAGRSSFLFVAGALLAFSGVVMLLNGAGSDAFVPLAAGAGMIWLSYWLTKRIEDSDR